MNVYYSTKFEGFWPVGTAAIIVAENADQAVSLLNAELKKIGLHEDVDASGMVLINCDVPKAEVILDGDY